MTGAADNGGRRSGESPRTGARQPAEGAAHLVEDGYDIRTVQALLGHASVETTMICTHGLSSGRCPVRGPLDQLERPPG
jgi:integrase